MFQLFKIAKSEEQLINEIHNEFDTAEDRLLQQADAVLGELNIQRQSQIENVANLSESIGFINSPVVKKAKDLQSKISVTRDQAETIRHYKQEYPLLKFLTENELEKICDKYNLVFAPIVRYIKDVPEKNLIEIKNAKPLIYSDVAKDHSTLSIKRFWSGCPDEIKNMLKGEVAFSGYSGAGSEPSEREVMKTLRDMGYAGLYNGYIFHDATITKIERSGLFIAAPKSHFNLKGLSKKNKYGFFSVEKREIKDPIVFRYCKGGIQVLSKWGLEASDELVINEKMN